MISDFPLFFFLSPFFFFTLCFILDTQVRKTKVFSGEQEGVCGEAESKTFRGLLLILDSHLHGGIDSGQI